MLIMIFRQDEQLRILRKLFDRYYGEGSEEGRFLVPGGLADTFGALQAEGLPLRRWLPIRPTPFVAPLLEALDIAKYFSVVIGGDDVQNKKPSSGPAATGG